MSSSLVRRVQSAVVKAPEPKAAPEVTPAARPVWSLAKYLRRMAVWWFGSWLVIVVACVAVAAHRVPFFDDMVGAAFLASLVTACASADCKARAASRKR